MRIVCSPSRKKNSRASYKEDVLLAVRPRVETCRILSFGLPRDPSAEILLRTSLKVPDHPVMHPVRSLSSTSLSFARTGVIFIAFPGNLCSQPDDDGASPRGGLLHLRPAQRSTRVVSVLDGRDQTYVDFTWGDVKDRRQERVAAEGRTQERVDARLGSME